MSPHDLRSNFQASGALQLEMRCRTPWLDSVSRSGRAVCAPQSRPEKRLYWLISGIATLLFCAIGFEPSQSERSGFGIASKSAEASGQLMTAQVIAQYYISPEVRQSPACVGRVGPPVTARDQPGRLAGQEKRPTIPILSLSAVQIAARSRRAAACASQPPMKWLCARGS
jgi:hypothetical protein